MQQTISASTQLLRRKIILSVAPENVRIWQCMAPEIIIFWWFMAPETAIMALSIIFIYVL